MPNTLATIADRGHQYTNFYITDPLCCPSRTSIMTGQLNHNNHVTGNSLPTFHLDMNTTLQHYLHQAGYQTWISGKFLNGWTTRRAAPTLPTGITSPSPGAGSTSGSSSTRTAGSTPTRTTPTP